MAVDTEEYAYGGTEYTYVGLHIPRLVKFLYQLFNGSTPTTEWLDALILRNSLDTGSGGGSSGVPDIGGGSAKPEYSTFN